jgi:hypothetical protein
MLGWRLPYSAVGRYSGFKYFIRKILAADLNAETFDNSGDFGSINGVGKRM